MASVAVQREKAPQTTAPVRRVTGWEPFNTMRELLRWDPFSEMAPAWTSNEVQTFMPDFEVKETPQAFVFNADMASRRKTSRSSSPTTASRFPANGNPKRRSKTKPITPPSAATGASLGHSRCPKASTVST